MPTESPESGRPSLPVLSVDGKPVHKGRSNQSATKAPIATVFGRVTLEAMSLNIMPICTGDASISEKNPKIYEKQRAHYWIQIATVIFIGVVLWLFVGMWAGYGLIFDIHEWGMYWLGATVFVGPVVLKLNFQNSANRMQSSSVMPAGDYC